MHISEGVLGAPVLAAGAALALGGIAVGLKKMDHERLPQVAIMAATFFVASLINVPIGPVKEHLVLNGLLGLLLGWGAFPAIFVALALQAMLFQFGGLTTLGINTLNMALPAILCHLALGPLARNGGSKVPLLAGFLAGFLGVGIAAVLVAVSLSTAGQELLTVARLVVVAHLPVMLIEGLITGAMVGFLRRVRPAMLGITGY